MHIYKRKKFPDKRGGQGPLGPPLNPPLKITGNSRIDYTVFLSPQNVHLIKLAVDKGLSVLAKSTFHGKRKKCLLYALIDFCIKDGKFIFTEIQYKLRDLSPFISREKSLSSTNNEVFEVP